VTEDSGATAGDKQDKTSQQAADNFLLTPTLLTPGEDGIGKRRSLRNRGREPSGHTTDVKEEAVDDGDSFSHTSFTDPSGRIKQEPIDAGEDYSQGLVSSFAKDMSPARTQPLSSRGYPQQPTTAQTASPKLTTEKLKTFSNMSLRDILTMTTEAAFLAPPSDPAFTSSGKRASSSSRQAKRPSASFKDGNHPYQERTASDSDVMWECGFCDFSAHEKSVVMAHRQQRHADMMAEAGFAGMEGGDGDPGREDDNDDDRDDARDERWLAEQLAADEWRNRPTTSDSWMTASQRLLMEYARAQKEQLARHGKAASSGGGGRAKGSRYEIFLSEAHYFIFMIFFFIIFSSLQISAEMLHLIVELLTRKGNETCKLVKVNLTVCGTLSFSTLSVYCFFSLSERF
jgi:hypothetical protein